jgi:hypothetical protein
MLETPPFLLLFFLNLELSQGEINVQPDRDSNLGPPRNALLRLYLLSYPAACKLPLLFSEQFHTVT